MIEFLLGAGGDDRKAVFGSKVNNWCFASMMGRARLGDDGFDFSMMKQKFETACCDWTGAEKNGWRIFSLGARGHDCP